MTREGDGLVRASPSEIGADVNVVVWRKVRINSRFEVGEDEVGHSSLFVTKLWKKSIESGPTENKKHQ